MEINLIKGKPESHRKDSPALVFVHGAWHGAWCWQEHFILSLPKMVMNVMLLTYQIMV